MIDRELLKWAAIAWDLGALFWSERDDTFYVIDLYDEDAESNSDAIWNPLYDDGDSLRLAVKLGLSIDRDFDRIDVYRQRDLLACEYLYQLPEPTDPSAATRRAIVRAAAAIGQSMETQAEKNARFRRALDEMPTAAPPHPPGTPGSKPTQAD